MPGAERRGYLRGCWWWLRRGWLGFYSQHVQEVSHAHVVDVVRHTWMLTQLKHVREQLPHNPASRPVTCAQAPLCCAERGAHACEERWKMAGVVRRLGYARGLHYKGGHLVDEG
jgi:hypothetical protein